MYVHVVILLAATVLVLGAASSSADTTFNFEGLPTELQIKIMKDHVRSSTDLCHLVLACRLWLPSFRQAVVHALFESPTTPDDSIPELIRDLVELVRGDPESRELVRNVRPPQAMGLYHEIMSRHELSTAEKSDLLRDLISGLGLSVLNNETSLYNQNRSGDEKFALSDLITSVPRQSIPDDVIQTLNRWVQDNANLRIDGNVNLWVEDDTVSQSERNWGIPSFLNSFFRQSPDHRARIIHGNHLVTRARILSKAPLIRLRDSYPSPFCYLHSSIDSAVRHLLRSFPKHSHPLADSQVVLALRQYGVVVPLSDFFTYVEVLYAASVLICAGDIGVKRALALLRIRFVQRLIVNISRETDFRYFSNLMRSASNEFLDGLIALPFMNRIVHLSLAVEPRNMGPCYCTLLDWAILNHYFNMARTLMRIPTISLYLDAEWNYGIKHIIEDLLWCRSNAHVREFLESPEFVTLILRDIPSLISILTLYMNSQYVEQFRALIQYSFYINIPQIHKLELADLARDRDNLIYQILRTTTIVTLSQQ